MHRRAVGKGARRFEEAGGCWGSGGQHAVGAVAGLPGEEIAVEVQLLQVLVLETLAEEAGDVGRVDLPASQAAPQPDGEDLHQIFALAELFGVVTLHSLQHRLQTVRVGVHALPHRKIYQGIPSNFPTFPIHMDVGLNPVL